MTREHGALIDGEWLSVDELVDRGEATRLERRAPFDGALLGHAAEVTWSAMDRALAAAARASRAFASTPRRQRQVLLAAIARRVGETAEPLAVQMAVEVGKPIAFARAEVTRLRVTFELAARLLDGPEREELPLDYDARGVDYRCAVERVALGPVLAIVPYNWPYNLAAHKLAPALAAGNPVVLKPSPLAVGSTLALAAILHECGAPPGVVNAVGCAPDVADRAVRDPRVALVSFTGSERVGYQVRAAAPDKPVVLELGGDASVVVFADADLDWAAKRAATSGYGYAGQVCISAQHVRVEASAYDGFRERLVAETRATRAGDPLDPATVCGPLITDAAAARAMGWIDEAVRGGARLLAGGRREGNVIVPTLLEDVPPTCALATEEAFAPVLTLSRFATEEEAFAQVNRSRFGIHASVFTRDEARFERAFRALEVGGVVANDFPSLRFDGMPYGGVKRSGLGREGVRYAYEEMTLPKVLLARR